MQGIVPQREAGKAQYMQATSLACSVGRQVTAFEKHDGFTLLAMLCLSVSAAREGVSVDLRLDLLGGVCDKDGTGGVAGTHLSALPLHSASSACHMIHACLHMHQTAQHCCGIHAGMTSAWE